MGYLVRRKRFLWLATGSVIVALLAVSNLWWGLWELDVAQGTFSMAYGLPACSGLWLGEGITYRFRDPHRGEIVIFRARGAIGSQITPDPHSRQLNIDKCVIGIPGDTVVGRDNRVLCQRSQGRRHPYALVPFPFISAPSSTSCWATTGAPRRTAVCSGRSLGLPSTPAPS